jgi:hypothetical protein
MFHSITLKFTEAPASLEIPARGVTVFVSPNNLGKRLILRELEADVSSNPEGFAAAVRWAGACGPAADYVPLSLGPVLPLR